MAGAFGRSAGLVYLGMVVMLLLGLAAPASSVLVNSSNPLTCSSQCESKDCSDMGSTAESAIQGCSGQKSCDGLDTCCETHDSCIGSDLGNYLNRTCNEQLKTCVTNFRNSNQAQFSGANCSASDVEKVILVVMEVATLGGYGNPSSPINLHWAAISVFTLSVVLLHSLLLNARTYESQTTTAMRVFSF